MIQESLQNLSDHSSSYTSQNIDFLENPEAEVAGCLWVYWQHLRFVTND